jgi:hypothetical protein
MSTEAPPDVQCGNCGAQIRFEPGQLVGNPDTIGQVKELAVRLRNAREAAQAVEFARDLLLNADEHRLQDPNIAGALQTLRTLSDQWAQGVLAKPERACPAAHDSEEDSR